MDAKSGKSFLVTGMSSGIDRQVEVESSGDLDQKKSRAYSNSPIQVMKHASYLRVSPSPEPTPSPVIWNFGLDEALLVSLKSQMDVSDWSGVFAGYRDFRGRSGVS